MPDPKGGGSGSPQGTYLNILKNVLGAGMLQMPFVFGLCGWALGPLVVIGVQIAALWALFMLMRACDAARLLGADASSYSGLASAAFGPSARTVIELLVLCYTSGTLVGYGVLVVDFFGTPLRQLVGAELSRGQLLLGAGCLVYPLCCMRHIEGLRPTSLAGNCALLYALVLVGTRPAPGGEPAPLVAAQGGAGVLQALPMLVFAFNFHYNLPLYYSELRGRTPRRMLGIVALVYLTATAAYLYIGFWGYYRWGERALPNIINNYPVDDGAFVICRIGLGAMIVCTFPIIQVAARSAAGRLAGLPQGRLWPRLAVSAVHVAAVLSLSVAVPNIGVAVAFNAATFGVAQHYILPGAFFLALTGRGEAAAVPQWQRAAAVATMLLGVAVGTLGIGGTLARLSEQ